MFGHIKTITLRNGGSLELGDSANVVVVGPNNSGKSTFLHELNQAAYRANSNSHIVTGLTFSLVSKESLIAALEPLRVEEKGLQKFSLPGAGQPLSEAEIQSHWVDAPPMGARGSNIVQRVLVSMHATNGRLAGNFQGGRPDYLNPGSLAATGVTQLLVDPAKLKFAQEVFLQAFRKYLFADHFGQQVVLRVSDSEISIKPSQFDKNGLLSKELQNEIANIPTVNEQGDGYRAFTNLLLEAIVPGKQVLLVDEPEAFLHPPQSRLIGKLLSESKSQTLVATHSTDILLGALKGSRNSKLHILRLSRSDAGAKARNLDPAALSKIWRDPALRHSRVLDALMHDGAVICEGSTDCDFLSAAYDELRDENDRAASEKRVELPDLIFLPAYGKGNFAKILRALLPLGVPCSVITDIDFLNTLPQIKSTLTAFDIEVDDATKNVRTQLAAAIRKAAKPSSRQDLRTKVLETLDAKSGSISEDELEKARALFEKKSGWKPIKRGGRSALPNAGAKGDFDKIQKWLKQNHIHVLSCGEIEGFHDTAAKNSEWLHKALKASAHKKPEVAKLLQDVIGDLRQQS